MDATQRSTLKDHMRRELASLRDKVAQYQETQEPVSPDAAIGRLSRLDTMLNQGIQDAALVQAKQRILKLERALQRVDADGFGECVECGEPIAPSRLAALPETEHCVDCAE